MDYRIILYIFFGILPSLAWLTYYLRKDPHPESKTMILKVFLWGALVTFLVFLVQISFSKLLTALSLSPLLTDILYWFLVIAFSEEIFKYLVVKSKVLSSHVFDEPIDAMIYMIIVALGFAALENVLYLFPSADQAGTISFNALVNRTLIITSIRFVGSTFLHTLCSGIIGYFLALSIYQAKNSKKLLFLGILGATLLHGFYNFSIMKLDWPFQIIIPIAILTFLAFFVISGFERLKKIKSVCLIKT